MTQNFSIDEFQCKCGCKMPADVHVNIVKLANNLQVLRNHLKRPITINSAYRCENHNRNIGGVPNSQHVQGKAADIVVKNLQPKQIQKAIDELILRGDMLQGGIGIYNTFTHYDIRKTKARWDYRN